MPTWTQAEIDAAKAKYASMVKSVAYGDKAVTNQDLDAMRRAIDLMEADNAAVVSSGGSRTTYASFSRD